MIFLPKLPSDPRNKDMIESMDLSEDCSAGIDVSGDGGVVKVIKTEGSGEETPCEGSVVHVHYVGTLLNGEEFDSSRKRGKHFDFVLGRGQVIQAWELAVETMKKGEICTLTCKAEYAYGQQGRPPTIPENATLVFEIELLYWFDEKVTFDELVVKRILKNGTGNDTVDNGGTVDVHLIGKDGDRVFDERDVQFTVGEAGDCDVIPAVDAAVDKMKKGEIALITADSSHAFGEKGRPEWNIAPNATIKYEVHLKSFEKLKSPWELSSEERMDGAKLVKAKGAEYFKLGDYSLALSKFTRLVALVESLTTDEELKQAAPLILAGHLNMALCYLKLGKYKECVSSCDKALDREGNNIKALYRKARAQLSMQYLDEAKELFEKVLKLDPKNNDARTHYLTTKKKLEEHRKKEKKVFANMFDKFAAEDAKTTARSNDLQDGKDVFDRAKEDSKNVFGDEEETTSPGNVTVTVPAEEQAAIVNDGQDGKGEVSETVENQTVDSSEQDEASSADTVKDETTDEKKTA